MPLLLQSTFLFELTAHTSLTPSLIRALWLRHFLTISNLMVQNTYIDRLASTRLDVHTLLYIARHHLASILLFLAEKHLNKRLCIHAMKLP